MFGILQMCLRQKGKPNRLWKDNKQAQAGEHPEERAQAGKGIGQETKKRQPVGTDLKKVTNI